MLVENLLESSMRVGRRAVAGGKESGPWTLVKNLL